jgi:hypothetical protein
MYKIVHLGEMYNFVLRKLDRISCAINVLKSYECYSNGPLLESVCGSANLLSKQNWPSIWWLGMLGETGRGEVTPMYGNGDFLVNGSPRISAHPCQMLGFNACGSLAGDELVCT